MAPGHRTAASCHRRRACEKNGQQQRTVVRGRDPGLRWLQRKTGEIHCTYMDSPLDLSTLGRAAARPGPVGPALVDPPERWGAHLLVPALTTSRGGNAGRS